MTGDRAPSAPVFGRLPIRYGTSEQLVIWHSLISFGWLHVQSRHLARIALIGVRTRTRMPFLVKKGGARSTFSPDHPDSFPREATK